MRGNRHNPRKVGNIIIEEWHLEEWLSPHRWPRFATLCCCLSPYFQSNAPLRAWKLEAVGDSAGERYAPAARM